ncbi:hypothetical protein PLESTB_000617000 [Pleodorina starrii]|uniref:Protein kinase domain-containing protein n=1 Tax=Pleodorina starrii TaxID=330485 RepID=A0A9W6BHT9_9CHLO|nr:hypothetical protein PLESTB_000617000 [Pleodorina starrii]
MPEGPGALLRTEAEDKPRIRVRLHFGGTFAQDGPRQWRYVGGEVYNESFPLESSYSQVAKRLNDKFGDTVSFKYLCPGDDIDPDNLVQVQGDDDLREMCDEYQNALQKSSTPVKTVRIKVFVFRAVIFEREVQELDEELGEDDELLDLPDDGEPFSSCDHAECGPNWSDWGEPDEQEVTQSSMPSAHISTDAEHHTSAAAAAAAAAATAALHNISMSVNSINSGRSNGSAPNAPLTSAGTLGDAGGRAPPQLTQLPPGMLAQQPQQQQRLSAHGDSAERSGGAAGGAGVGGRCSSGGYAESSGARTGGAAVAEAAAAAAAVFPHAYGALGVKLDAEADIYDPLGVYALADSAYAEAEYGAGWYEGPEEVYGEAAEEGAEAEAEAAVEASAEAEEEDEGRVRGLYGRAHEHGQEQQQRPLHEERSGFDWMGTQGERRGPVQGDWRHGRERGLERSQLEQQQQQERQRTLEQRQAQERQNLNRQDSLLQSGLGFYCNEELEDPYGDPYDDDAVLAAAAGAGFHVMRTTEPAGGRNRSSAASDGAVRVLPRAADVAAFGDHAVGQYGGYGIGGAGAGGGGLLARLPAAADMLPRHISAFGESSRDDSQGGGRGASGPQLPSRITIFGDDESLSGTQCGGSTSGGGRLGGAAAAGGLHRLAVLGALGGAAAAGGVAAWLDPHAASGDAVGGKSGTTGLLGPGDDLVAGDSRLCITQEFGTKERSSLLEPGEHGGLESGVGDGMGDALTPLGPLDPLSRGLGAGLGMLGGDGLDNLSPSSAAHNHPLKGVVKKRKSEVSIMAKIGEGAFGEVSQAQVFPYGIVAVKWLKRERFAKYSESFQREAETLAKLNHPNIIRMYGLVMDTPDSPAFGGGATSGGGAAGPAAHLGSGGGSGGNSGNGGSGTPTGLIGGIITEFVRNGSLGQYLRSLNGRRLSLRQRAMIALQAALGMAYLHEQSPAVVHFDLKPDNLLVDGEGDSMVIKVADFGLSKHKLSNYVSCRDLRGTLPYMAYELVSGNNNISEKVDVYSMGVVMWEMYTGEVPFAHLTAQEILTGLLHGNLHLAIPPACEPEWRSLVETCMDPNPTNRPSFQELAMQLQEILRLERQASNASSASAAAAAAVAAVLDSDATGRGDSGGAAAATAAAGTAGGGGAGLGQWRLPAQPPAAAPAAAAAQPQVRSPGAVPPMPQAPPPPLLAPQALLARQQQQLAAAAAAQQQQHPLSPPLQQPPPPLHTPLLVALQQQQRPQPQAPQPLPPFQLQQQYGNAYNMQQAMRQPATPPLQPQPPSAQAPPQPVQQHIHYLQQLTPGLILPPQQQQQQQQQPPQPQQHPVQLPQAHLYALPLRPQALFQPQQQQHGQHLNGLYGLAGGVGVGVGGTGLPPLVSWGDRGM